MAGSGIGISLLAAARGGAETPAPSAPASPFVKPSGKPPTAVALALAATMRRFDPQLTDAELDTIARGIDANRDLGPQLAPKKKPLKNGDEPVTQFRLLDVT